MSRNVFDLKCAPIPIVRVGFIGLGARGLATLRRYMRLERFIIRAICDISEHQIEIARHIIGHAVNEYVGNDSWRDMIMRDDIDLIVISTDWSSHATLSIAAMRAGKHVVVEVPAATTIEECWAIVETVEETHRHCFMAENCCFDPFHLTTLSILRSGILGRPLHAEGAYIHYLNEELKGNRHDWWKAECERSKGNPYPTHGAGPALQTLGISEADLPQSIVSMSVKHNQYPQINESLISTRTGKLLTLHFDITTPRPYSRVQGVSLERGYIAKYPIPTIGFGNGQISSGDEAMSIFKSFSHPWIEKYRPDAERLGVDNLMNYIMDRRLEECLSRGLPLDISVYDAATWSALAPLSHISATQGGREVEIPDFTRNNVRLIV